MGLVAECLVVVHSQLECSYMFLSAFVCVYVFVYDTYHTYVPFLFFSPVSFLPSTG